MSEPIKPSINELNAPFWDAAMSGKLVLPHCTGSDHPFWPPCPVSPFITSGNVVWREVKPYGVLTSVITYHRVFQKILAKHIPYQIGLVELDCGVRLQAFLADSGSSKIAQIDSRVRITFAQLVPEGIPVPTIVHTEIAEMKGCE